MSEFPEMYARWDTFGSPVWYRSKAGRYRLEGSRCKACGNTFFPGRLGLICPVCHQRQMEPYAPPMTGELVCVAPDNLGFPATAYETTLPRQMAIVRLDDGTHVMSEVMDVMDAGQLVPGARVKMVLRKHKREDTGAWVYGFRFVLEG